MNKPDMTDTLNWGAASQKGARKQLNEDAHDFFTQRWDKDGKTAIVMMVADGISSTKGGGRASQIAVETIKSVLTEPSMASETTSDRMAEALTLANQEILFQARQNPEWSRMGTTVVLALIVDSRLYVMGLGDSRAYLIRNGQAHRLTTDHTWAQYTRDAQHGEDMDGPTPPYAEAKPDRSPLVRYLGNPHSFHIDRGIFAPGSQRKEEYISIQRGDSVLLCSDGIHKLVSEPELSATIRRESVDKEARQVSATTEKAVSALVALAQEKGETDDITAVLLNLSERDQPEPALESALESALEATSDVRAARRQRSARILRFAMAAVIALLLLIFQFGYRQQSEGGVNSIKEVMPSSTAANLQEAAEGQSVATETPTATTTLQPGTLLSATPQPAEQNNTVPPPLASPTKVLPTASLPTPTSEGN